MPWQRRLTRLIVGVVATTLGCPAVLIATISPAHAATTRYVAVNDPSCSDSGPGNASGPYCSIIRAAEVAVAGDTVLVSSGTYVGEVEPANSGTSLAPITYRAATGANVVVTGGDRGFTLRSRSWITIQGFQVTGTADNGIYLKSSTSITVRDNRVSFAGQPGSSSTTAQGIYVIGTKNSSLLNNVTDHNSDTGIYVTTGNSGIDVRGNTSFSNARGYTRAATGIDMRSAGNTIVGNRSYRNEDSGIQLYNGAHFTKVYNNVVYGNGDHGIDVLNSTDTVIVSNSVFNNVTAGINLEGATGTAASSRGTLRNNISVENGLASTSTRGNVRVDARSLTGTTMNRDLMSLSTSGTMVTWGATLYSSLSALRTATGQEQQGIQADPMWVAPSADDFHLRSGSPAIDSADSGAPSQPLTDLEGTSRVDDPAMANTGAGPRLFDDRGALEHKPVPVAALTVTPATGDAPLMVNADASASSSPIGIASYAFTFGDGSPGTGPQASALTFHTYTNVGTYTMTVTVTDTQGQSSQATAQVRSRAPDEPPTAALTVTPTSGVAALTVTADASGSTDPDPTPIATYSFDFGDGTIVGPQADSAATHTYPDPGSFTVTVTVTDTAGKSSTASRPVTVTDPNLVGNRGFEVDTTGWNGSGRPGITVTRVSGGHSGAWAGRVTNTTTTTQPDCTLNDAPNWVTTTKAGSYTASVWVRSDVPDQLVKMRLREYNAGTFVGSSPIVSASVGDTWTKLSVDLTVLLPGSSLDLTAYLTNAPPGACFTADDISLVHHKPVPSAVLTLSTASGKGPLHVDADASGSSSPIGIASYDFDFGDGSPGTGAQTTATASHTYTEVGTHTLSVTVTDTDGQSSQATASVQVRPEDEPPDAVLSVTPSSGPAALSVTADASGSTDPDATPIASYTFDFGDGGVVGPQAASTAAHIYTDPGSYAVTVTVTDTAGQSSTASKTVTVTDPNLVGNPGFETNTSGWNANGRTGITITRVAGGHSGGWAAQMTNTTTATQADCTLNDAPNWVASTAAGSYTASMWVRSDVLNQVVRLRLREYNAGAFVGSSPVVTATVGGTWTRLTVDYTPQIAGSNLDLTAYVTSAAPGTCFTADDISITRS